MQNGSRYAEEPGYVNIHGNDVRVFLCEKTGRILVPIDEIQEIGFRLFQKSQYSRLLVGDSQFNKEFDLYMLQAAQSYMLQNRVAFTESAILDSIDKVKRVLTQNETGSRGTSNINNNVRSPPKPGRYSDNDNSSNNFNHDSSPTTLTRNHNVKDNCESPTVSTTLRQPTTTTMQNIQNSGFSSFKNNCEQNKGRNSFERPNARSPRDSNGNSNLPACNGEEAEKFPFQDLTKQKHTVIVSYVVGTQYFVQDVENAEILLEIDAQIEEEVKQAQAPKRTAYGKIYLAMDDGNWYRCKLIRFKPLTVMFVDYGNTSVLEDLSQLREVSSELLKHPGQAIKVVFKDNVEKPKLNDTVAVTVIKKFDNGPYLVEIPNSDSSQSPSVSSRLAMTKPAVTSPIVTKPTVTSPNVSKSDAPKLSVPSIPTHFTKPPFFCDLKDGQRVMIIGHEDGKIALRTKESYDLLRQIEFTLDKEEAKVAEKVEKGQIVLCKKERLQRAVVLNVQRDAVEVELLDYCEKMKVDGSLLCHINESLATQKMTYLTTPAIKGYSDDVDEIVGELGKNKAKATVVMSGGEVDLMLGDGLLSEKFKPKSTHPTLKDLQSYEPPMGVGEYTLNIYSNKDDVYFGSLEALEEYLEVVVKTDLDDNKPHKPVQGEVCLGCYQDSWSRCVVLSVANLTYSVRFIDFGNVEDLESKELRILPADCQKAPVLAFHCQLTGYPHVDGIERLLSQKMKALEEKSVSINVVKFDGTTYEIKVPQVYDALV